MSQRWPAGMKVLVVFFAFGATACAVTVAALLTPGGTLDIVWRLNPEAHLGFQKIGTAFPFCSCLWWGQRAPGRLSDWRGRRNGDDGWRSESWL